MKSMTSSLGSEADTLIKPRLKDELYKLYRRVFSEVNNVNYGDMATIQKVS